MSPPRKRLLLFLVFTLLCLTAHTSARALATHGTDAQSTAIHPLSKRHGDMNTLVPKQIPGSEAEDHDGGKRRAERDVESEMERGDRLRMEVVQRAEGGGDDDDDGEDEDARVMQGLGDGNWAKVSSGGLRAR